MAAIERISILGAGAWGTALANAIARKHRPVTLWARDPAVAAEIANQRSNAARLPGIAVSPDVQATAALERALDADALLLAVPAQSLRKLASMIAPALPPSLPLIACAKGIERDSRRFVTEIIAETVPQSFPAILSGPSFAHDVARGLPTAVTLAAPDETLAVALADVLRSPVFRLYHSTDIRGVEIGGAAKNVLAIAAGIVAGRNLGASAHAALTTRGFAELVRFGRACGARPETLMGLSGFGDVILTCSSPQSRNYALGIALGRGRTLAEASAGRLAEGVFTAPVLAEIARAHGVEMPIAAGVDDLLAGRRDIDTVIDSLLARPMGPEL